MTTKRRPPGVFYGWYIVAGLATVGMVSVGMGGMNIGLFVEPMHSELGINHTTFGFTQTARAIGFSISSIFLGRILDTYGARVPMAIASILMAGIMIAMAFIQSGWQLVGLLFLFGFIGLEGAGGNLYQSVPLSRWFIRQRGKAMSIAFTGTTLGLFVFTPLLQFMITRFGWRVAWAGVGSIACLIVFFIAVVIVRKEPAVMGLLPDGELAEDAPDRLKTATLSNDQNGSGAPFPGEFSFTRAQALKTVAFWGLIAMLALRMLAVSTLIIFRIPFFIEKGIDPQLVAFAISVEAFTATAISIPTGWAMDRFQPRFIAAATLSMFIIAIIMTINVASVADVFVACGLFGLSSASFQVAHNAIWPNYFGGLHIGSIRGIAIPFTVFFGAVGAPLTGRIKDITGSYTPAWIAAAVLVSMATVIMLLNRAPKRPTPYDGKTGK